MILDGMGACEEFVVTCLLPHPCCVGAEPRIVSVNAQPGHKPVLSKELVCPALYLQSVEKAANDMKECLQQDLGAHDAVERSSPARVSTGGLADLTQTFSLAQVPIAL